MNETSAADPGETEEWHAVRDGRGCDYRVELSKDQEWWTVRAYDRDTRAAYVNCQIRGETLFVQDFHVYESAQHPLPGWLARIKSRLGFPASGRVENYQRHGLGTALLDFVIRQARDRGFRQIEGTLAPNDLMQQPWLPDWYRFRGFQVVMSPSGTSGVLRLDARTAPDQSGSTRS